MIIASHPIISAYGFGRACDDVHYACFARCIGHDHAHLVIERHDRDPEVAVGHLKAHSTRELTRRGNHPLNGHLGARGGLPTPWSEGCWKVFIDHKAQLRAAISYVQRHPRKERLPDQQWGFVRDEAVAG